MRHLFVLTLVAAVFITSGLGAERYTGPRPPKPDVPYLLHADNLLETEAATAKEDTRKDLRIATVPGATSNVKTPLAEPIFVIKPQKFRADKFGVYRMTVRNGNREVVVDAKNAKNVSRPIHVVVTRLDDALYKIEVDEPLENGEYTLSPEGSDDVFSFAIN